ncbi:twin-arginine translocase subunit TatC [Aliiglaciecola sp. 2_MG-2023]|uniref:twin-arginine translocase subunit TatC n=1 Tax=unclassified Aliiglaciecola TaxID=2593648 RepID=UPI0026E28017|nr:MULTISPECIES: twin-arginine translocase subunit TatC [unclassified Aliiglaciecola]MDO6712708.1 twin-arginine translocase subunit TatC [Aliiglaciecola sp. 2_MG-2023]MDO6752907.1 twin-arginine translocase subunit TatC [Aliiglaciecola sp. 1_MG-2023]
MKQSQPNDSHLNNDGANKSHTENKAPLLTHLIELRRRLLFCFAFFALMFGVSYFFAEQIYSFLQQPLYQIFGPDSGRRMIYTGLHEAFFTYIKLAFFSATFCTLPITLIQVWKFIAPGMYKNEQKALSPLFIATPILFVMGAALAFYVVMPLAWEFFISFESSGQNATINVELEAKMSEYLALVIRLILAFGLCFELPVLLLVLAKAGVIDGQTLKDYRKHAVVAVFFIAALITPPDLISQIALGVPILALYELSIVLINWTQSDKQQILRKQMDQSN